MKKNTIQAIISLSIFAFLSSGTFSNTCMAAPIQDTEKSELEEMIMKKIEERKKQLAEERAAKGETAEDDASKSTSNQSPASRSRRTTDDKASNRSTPKVSESTAKKARAVRELGNARVNSARPAVSTPAVVNGQRSTVPKVPALAERTTMTESTKPINPDVKIQFDFKDAEWSEVIQYIADEVGYGVFMGSTGAPEGTISVSEPEKSLLEALDYVNSRLGILDPPHVLVRNGSQLVLVNESDRYPQPLIAIVRPEQLYDYGKYEVVRCVFDLENLDGNELQTQIRELVSEVHLDGFSYIPAANRMEIRERVLVLRELNQIVQRALQKEIEVTVLTFEPQHIEPENLLFNLRQMMGISEGQFQTEDGSLRFSVQPLGNKIFLTGTPKRIKEFERMANIIDVEFFVDDQGIDEKPYLKTHGISGDIEVVFQVVQTLLDGEPNVKLDKDTESGSLYVWAAKSVQDDVANALQEMAGGVSFAIIPVKNIRPSDAVSTIEELLNIDTFSDNPTGPKLVADIDNDCVMVHGSPQEIVLVRRMIDEIDENSDISSGPRQTTRFIEAPVRETDKVMEFLKTPGIMDTMGKRNRLNLILPSDRGSGRGRNRLRRETSQPSNQGSETRDQGSGTKGDVTTTFSVGANDHYYVSTFAPQESDDNSRVGQTTQQDPQEPVSVPGADIDVRQTDLGIVIHSKDLDAADALEARILDMLGEDSSAELPQVYSIKYRKVAEIKAVLEHIFGIQSSGGGGGGAGGIGGLIGGAVQNAVGGSTGDVLGGLLGGGGGGLGSDSAGAFELEGEDVRMVTDTRLNYLFITGATTNDLDFIDEIIDLIDVDSPPEPPADLGQTYVIEINYRDPMKVKELVEEMLADRFKNAASGNANGGRQQNAEQQIQQAVLRQLQGGRNRRGGNTGGQANSASEQPKATLGIDEERGALLVTGPEFIYVEVKNFVQKLDIKQNVVLAIEPTKMDPVALANYLKDMFPNNVEIVMNNEEDGAGGTGSAAGGGTARRSSGSSRGGSSRGNANVNSATRAIQDAIRQGRTQGGRGVRAPGR